MDISSLSPGAASNQASDQAKRRSTLNQEDFMNLFVAQMKNQNPLEPLDNYQIASQMAQFSSLESLGSIDQALQNLTAYQSSMNSLQAAALIGKRVEASGNQLFVETGSVSEGVYQLSKPGKATIKIYDSSQQLVRTLEGAVQDASKQKFTWDGKDQSGNSLPDGTYTFEISAVDGQGQGIKVDSWMIGKITGVAFENGIAYLKMGSGKITISDIRAILA